MNTTLFLAKKGITGDKRKSFFLIGLISVVLLMTIAISVVKENILVQRITTAKIKNGDWHIVLPIDDVDVINETLKNTNVSAAGAVKRLNLLTIDADTFDCYLIDSSQRDLLVERVVTGSFPSSKNEILAPDWYLRKQDIKTLPAKLTYHGFEFTITGAYKSIADSISGNIKVFLSLESGEDFSGTDFNYSPVDNIILEEEQSNTFAFIRLSLGSNLDEAIRQIANINGVYQFEVSDSNGDFLNNGAFINHALVAAQGFIDKSYKNNFINKNLSTLITIALLVILFVAIFVAMNLIINGKIKMCGILSSLGLANNKIRNIFLLQSLFISLIAVPVGVFLGLLSSYGFLLLSLGQLNGAVYIPLAEILICSAACIASVVLAALYPAIKAGKTSPVEAINLDQFVSGKDQINSGKPNLINAGSKLSFAARYAWRNVLINRQRVLSFIMVIALLLSVFVKLSAEVEKIWKEGNWRQSYIADFVLGLTHDANALLDYSLLNEIADIKGVQNVYYQYSVLDTLQKPDGYFDYYFKIDNDKLTDQGTKQLNLSCPLYRNGYEHISFVQAGLSGYPERELAMALNNLIEGDVTVELMKTEDIILLPKYILWYENIDIPYARLSVGDEITLVENKSNSVVDIDIVNEYTFTIGGFIDTLPFPQVNGVSNGFVAIMHHKHLDRFQTRYKGIVEIYIDGENSSETINALQTLSNRQGLRFDDNANNFLLAEKRRELELISLSFYSIFLVLGVVVFLSIFNILLSNILLRKNEFTLMHIVGVRRWQRSVVIITEVASFLLPGIILGCVIGMGLIISGDQTTEILSVSQLIPVTHILIGCFIILASSALATVLGIVNINNSSFAGEKHP